MFEEIIRRVPFFATLPPRHLRWLGETLQTQEILPGTVLFSAGECGDSFYIILQGEFEVFNLLADGRREVMAVRGPGECIGEMRLLHPLGLWTETAAALADAEVLVMSRTDFAALLQRYPPLGYQWARVLSQRLEETHTRAIRDLEERNKALQAALDELRIAHAGLLTEKQQRQREPAPPQDDNGPDEPEGSDG